MVKKIAFKLEELGLIFLQNLLFYITDVDDKAGTIDIADLANILGDIDVIDDHCLFQKMLLKLIKGR